jgi:hypothetical protein
MAQEHVDPVYEYIDETLKPIKRDLQQLNKSLLGTSRFLASLDINLLDRHLVEWIGRRLSKSTDPTYRQVREFLLAHSEASKEKASHSTKPLSVAKEFREDCIKYFKEHKLHAFRD